MAGSLITLSACSDSDYELDKLVPEEYHCILYINDSGKQSLTLFDTEDDYNYSFSVFKAGSDPKRSANVALEVMTQSQIDTEYSEPEGVNYKVIDASCYTLDATQLGFASSDRYKIVNIALKPQQVKAALQTAPDAVWVLPLVATSENDSISTSKNELILQLVDVVSPAIGFAKSSSDMKEMNYGSVSSFSDKVKFGLDVDNKWNLTCQFAIDDSYVAEYNEANGTFFKVLPESVYSLPSEMTLTEGNTNSEIGITVNAENLEPGDYMLPIRITGISQFKVSADKDLYTVRFRIMGTKLDRSDWTAEASSEELSGEGAVNGRANCLIDDNTSTFWHSKWDNGGDKLPYELILDMKNEHTVTQLGLIQRGNGFTDTGRCIYSISSDKTNWTQCASFTMGENTDVQVFSVNPAKGRYIKIRIESSYRWDYCSLSEVYVYGF